MTRARGGAASRRLDVHAGDRCEGDAAHAIAEFEGASGLAGFLEPDDAAVRERLQRGPEAQQPEWALLQRGRERELERAGVREGRMLDETAARGFWRYDRALVEGPRA